MMPAPRTTDTDFAIRDKIADLQEAIREHAADGDTVRCDVLHSRIATLEEAMAILHNEVD
jgi:hypothetical protein